MASTTTISSFIQAPPGGSSATILLTPGNATFAPLSQIATLSLLNGTISSVSTPMYTTVTSTRSFVISSTTVMNASNLHFASGTRSILLAPSWLNTVASIVNFTIFTGAPTSLQSSEFAASARQSNTSVSFQSSSNVATKPSIILTETTAMGKLGHNIPNVTTGCDLRHLHDSSHDGDNHGKQHDLGPYRGRIWYRVSS